MKTCLITLLVATSASIHAFAQSLIAAPQKPNVIFILADDLGIGNVSCYGSDNYHTPNIDKLAAGGIRFTHGFTAALCGPSRALIMTGRYAFRNGSTNQDACMVMQNSELQLARTFKAAGYTASFLGKWGQLPGEPDEAGFDDYLRFHGSGVYLNKKSDKAESYRVNRKELKLENHQYMPDLIHDRAVGFIKDNQYNPFFLYYSMVHVHGDIVPTPDSPPDSKNLFGDNILYMDKLVGKLVAELEALKLREKTLIIFMGDNGTGKGQNELSTIGGRKLSGMKGSMLECGGLVPMIANWPGTSPAGKVSADLVDSTDLLTTFAELAGIPLPENTTFDGRSFAPQLRGEQGKPREWIFNQLARMWYVRDAKWKLNQAGELYDMSDAPFTESLVVAEKQSSSAVVARARLAAVLADLNPAGGILDTGDGSGRHASKAAKKSSGAPSHSKPAANSIEKPSSDTEVLDRASKFDRLDKDKIGRLTREYYTTHQSDAAAAGERFDKWDTNRDGFLSREEYIAHGTKISK